jgi:hypothetical protein
VSNIDAVEALNQVAASLGKAAYVATTGPVRGRLMTANGSASSNGTEVVNAGGSTYASQDAGTAITSFAALPITNSSPVTWTNLPAATVVGLEIWDVAGTPKRKWFGPLAASKTVALGDSLSIAAGGLSVTTG